MGTQRTIVSSLSLRTATLASRFCFIFIAAKYLTLVDIGTYSLIAATIAYSLYLIGLDFYAFANRELISAKQQDQEVILLNQFRVHCICYAAFFVPLLSLFWWDIINWRWSPIFFLLLFTEYLSQEMIRIVISLGQPTKANWILFLRTASWSYLSMVVFLFLPNHRTIQFVLYSWSAASVASVIFGFWVLRFVPWKNALYEPLPLEWVWKGLRIAAPFFIATLAFRAIFTLDRYFIEWYDGLAIVGIYAIYAGISNTLITFIDAAVIQFCYPNLVKTAHSGDTQAFRRLMTTFMAQISCVIFACLLSIIFFAEWFFGLLEKPQYLDLINFFWWILAGTTLQALSYIPHYGLYALNRDRFLLWSNICPFILFVLTLSLYDTESGLFRIGVALVVTFSASLFIKGFGYLKYSREFLLDHAGP